ncbi:MAG TPA: dihydrolipoamide acetyltransferase family protein [Caulobacteraceae bacterium]|jgi:pyruvate dehydrogenase E2 component (dihydrolipoamide acetyltransferase)|nr:dihydrolipoamide acetyltransferase family protein [Caulobacteraceae bacterium]
MPQLGETVAEGKITKWFKSAGDAVKPGDNLFEIETDKTSMEVPATSAGTLTDIRFQVGEVAKVGAVVAIIAGAGGASAAPAPAAAAAAPAPKASIPVSATQVSPQQTWKPAGPMDPWREVRTPERNYGAAKLPGGATVTPLARRLAGERGIDLARISGTGPRGRIVARDVENAAPARGLAIATGASTAQVKALFDGIAYEEVPLDSMRRTIATRLIEAKQTIPHFYLTADIDIGRLMAVREEANASAPKGADKQPAFKLSLNDFIIKAWAIALTRVPAANAVWAEDRILRFTHADIGVAVALDGGLITPVLRNADVKSLTAISADMRDLAERARSKKLKPNEYQGGASAISNLGMYGVREFSAIINPPHATILAVGASRRAPVETDGGGVKFVSQMTVTLSCDHRVVDGALGAELLAAFKSLVEAPVTFLV